MPWGKVEITEQDASSCGEHRLCCYNSSCTYGRVYSNKVDLDYARCDFARCMVELVG